MTITLKKSDFTPLGWGELLARLNIKVHSPDISDKNLIAIEIDVKGCIFDVEGVGMVGRG